MPEIPFQNSYRGPAGEYSDAYKAIVDQYRNDVASAQQLRDQQAGIPMLQPTPGLIHKSRNDIVRIDPTSGQTQLLYRAPEPPARPMAAPRIEAPHVDPRELRLMDADRDTLKAALKRYETLQADPNTSGEDLANSQLDVKDARDSLSSYLTNLPVPTAPATNAIPAHYTPAPMMSPGEVAPPGSLIMGRNGLDVPLSPTQSTAKRFKYVNGKLVAQ